MGYAQSAYLAQGYSLGAGLQVIPMVPAGEITPAGALIAQGIFQKGFLQIDMNVGFAPSMVGTGQLQVDEDVLVLTAVLSRDGLLQVDENVLVKAAIPVTSY